MVQIMIYDIVKHVKISQYLVAFKNLLFIYEHNIAVKKVDHLFAGFVFYYIIVFKVMLNIYRYGLNGVCQMLPVEGVSDEDYEKHIRKCHLKKSSKLFNRLRTCLFLLAMLKDYFNTLLISLL